MSDKIKYAVAISFNLVLIVLLVCCLFRKRTSSEDLQHFITRDDFEKSFRASFADLGKSLQLQLDTKIKNVEEKLFVKETNEVERLQNDIKFIPRGYDFCIVDSKPVLYDEHFKELYTIGSVCPFSPRNYIENLSSTFIELSNGEVFIRDTRNSLVQEGMAQLAGGLKRND